MSPSKVPVCHHCKRYLIDFVFFHGRIHCLMCIELYHPEASE